MLSAIQKGDTVQTSGGLLGKVTGVDQSELTVEIAPQVRVKVGRGFISRVVRPGDGAPAAPASK
jgi:preprotein translocase subunit YajC